MDVTEDISNWTLTDHVVLVDYCASHWDRESVGYKIARRV